MPCPCPCIIPNGEAFRGGPSDGGSNCADGLEKLGKEALLLFAVLNGFDGMLVRRGEGEEAAGLAVCVEVVLAVPTFVLRLRFVV